MPRFIAIFLLLLLPGVVLCQYPYVRGRPHVVKDNVKCLYGLKNDSNQWVVQPQYTTLSDERYYFIAGNSEKKSGVINTRCQLILPVEYDKVIPLSWNRTAADLFIVEKNKKQGIIDSSGKEFLPLIYDRVSNVYLAPFPHRYFILQKDNQFALMDNSFKFFVPFSDDKLTTENYIPGKLQIIDKDGRHGLVDSTGIVIAPQYKSLEMLSRYASVFPDYIIATDMLSGKKGLINSHGDTLIPLEKAAISSPDNRTKSVLVENELETSFGLYDSSLQVLIPEGSRYIYSQYNQQLPVLPSDTCPVRRENKWGLMTGNGKWVTDQTYDTIIYPDFVSDNNRGHFMVKANGKYGVIDPSGKIIIPVEYDMLVQCSDKHTSSGGSGCVRTSYTYGTFFFVGKKNGSYGATKSDGRNFLPYIYDTVISRTGQDNWYHNSLPGAQYANGDLYFTSTSKAVYLKRGTESSFYYLATYNSIPYTLSYFFNVDKDIKVYRNEENYYPFRDLKMGTKTILVPAFDVSVDVDRNNFDQLEVRSGYYDEYSYFDRITGKPVINPLKGVQLVAGAGENHIFQSEQMKLGIISPQGKILLDPVYSGLFYTAAFDGKAYLWTKTSTDTTCGSFDPQNNCACGWRLCNLKGVPVSESVFDFPQALSAEVVPIVIDGKIGLFNVTKLKFVSAVVYKDITAFCSNTLNPTYDSYSCYMSKFFVTRANGQFGIMDSNGKWLTDSTFDYMIPYPRRNYSAAVSSTTNLFTLDRWLMHGSGPDVLVDNEGHFATDQLLIDSLIEQSYVLAQNQYRLSGWDRDPQYSQKGPQLGYVYPNNFPHNGEKLTNAQDSLYFAAVKTGTELLVDSFGYRLHQIPGSYSIGGTGYVVDQWAREQHVYVKTVQPKQSEYLQADIMHYSDKTISILTMFNPDSSQAGKSNSYPYYLNYQKTESGEYVPLTLDSIFCPTVQYQFVLNKLLREAVKKRDNLNLDCGNEDGFFSRTQGKFYLSDTGLVFVLQNAYIGIPWMQLQPYSRAGGIVDHFLGNKNAEHCRPAYDTTVVNYASQGINTMLQLQQSGYLSREKIASWNYLYSDSLNKLVNGIRYCNGSDMVIDVFFEPTVVKASPGRFTYEESAKLPKAIRKKKIVNFYSVKHYPCAH
jgi:hypothetical protein